MVQENNSIDKHIGNYRIIAALGSGSFADVYQAQHLIFTNEPPVAIKLLYARLKTKEREQFIQEAQLLRLLRHPHILPILDAGFQEGTPYIVMEYAPQGSLQDRLDQKPGQPFPIAEATTILTHIGEALYHAHQQNIVHRDLKPDNILFNAKGEALLADFGLATILSSARTANIGSAGTPAYMAPEMFAGQVSVKSDQYTLGCIAYELLTGRKPFEVAGASIENMWFQHAKVEPTTPTQYNQQLPSHIEQAILIAMAKDRNNRHPNIYIFLNALQVPQTRQKSAQEWFKKGYDFDNHKRYEEALVAYDQAIRLDPMFVFAYEYKALALYNLQRYEEAIGAYNQTLRLDPNKVTAYHNKGYALDELKRYEEALVAYDQAIRLDPNDALAYYGKGNTFYTLKRYEEAIGAYDQAIRLDPDYALAYYNKGVALSNVKRHKEALVAYDQAIRLDPNNALAYYNKGIALSSLKRYREALVAYDQTIRLDPNNALAYTNKGIAFEKLKLYEEAIAAYEQALRLDPNKANAYHNKGIALNNLNRHQEAIADFDQAIRLDPNNAVSHHGKGVVLQRLGRNKEAQQAYEKARQLGYKP